MLVPPGKNIDGDNFFCCIGSASQRGVVGHSQVAPKPVDDSPHFLFLKDAWPIERARGKQVAFRNSPRVELLVSFVRSFLTFVHLLYVSGGRAVASSMIYPVEEPLDWELGRLSLFLPGEAAVNQGRGRSPADLCLEK
jgi:hypothetical protein